MKRASLVVQWLGLSAATAGGTGSIPGWGTKSQYAPWSGQKKKKRLMRKKKNRVSTYSEEKNSNN